MQYQLRWMPFKGQQKPVILQLVNGPCPLIALCNVLFLRGKLVLRSDMHEISFEQLCSLLRAHLQRQVQDLALTSTNEVAVANSFQHLEEVSALLPKLEQGLDVNVMFTHPTALESTSELALFDLAGVRLLHGWCVDPEDRETARVIGNMSYNKLVDFITSGEEDVKRSTPLPAAAAASAAASSVAASSSSAVPAVSSAAAAASAAPSEEKADSEAAAYASPVAPAFDASVASALNPIADAAPLIAVASSPPPPLPPSPAAESPEAAVAMAPSDDAAAVSQAVDALVTSLEDASLSAVAPVVSDAVASPANAAPVPAVIPDAAEPVDAAAAVPAEAVPVPVEEKSDAAPTSAASSASSSAAVSSSSAAPSAASVASSSSAPAVAASPSVSAKSLEAQSLELAQSLFDKNIARAFLADTQSQLTVAGLALLHQVMRDDELAVLFRNNHFNLLYKRNTRLYTLCTDWTMISAAGYIHWSFCNDIAGDQLFLDQDFKIPHPTTVAMWAQRGPAPAPPRAMAPASPVQPVHPQQYPAAAANQFQPQPQQPYPLQQPSAPVPSVQQQQEQFARENGLRWNELTQNFEVLPQSQQRQPFQHPYPQHAAPSNHHAPGVKAPEKKNSCVLQ